MKKGILAILVGLMISNFALFGIPIVKASSVEFDKITTEVTNNKISNKEYNKNIAKIEKELNIKLNDDQKEDRAIALSVILAAAARIFGKAAVAWVSKKILDLGLSAACKKYNDSNKVMDFVCDATNQYRD